MTPSFASARNPSLGYALLTIALLVLPTSHALQGLIGYRINDLFLVVLLALLALGLHSSRGRCHAMGARVALVVLFFGTIGSFVSGIMQQFLIGCAWAGMLIAASLVHPVVVTRLGLRLLIGLNVIILIGAGVGFAYAFLGNAPLLQVINPENKQVLSFYLTTFTNTVIRNVIRPSGFFDEPGALVMFTLIVVCLNELHGGKRVVSIALLLLNLITFSMMALLAVAAYLFFIGFAVRSRRSWAWASLILVILAGGYLAGGSVVRSFYVRRLTENKGAFVTKNNRTTQVVIFFHIVDSQMVLKGAEPGTYVGVDQSSNPFSIMYSSGVFVWVPYVFVVLWLFSFLWHRSHRLRFAGVLLALLLLQRPYVYSMYWGLLLDVLLMSIYKCQTASGRLHGASAGAVESLLAPAAGGLDSDARHTDGSVGLYLP